MGTVRRVDSDVVPVPAPAYPGVRGAASAPAKCILLGEHAVVYGEPCLSIALAGRTRVVADCVGDRFKVNGYPMNRRHHTFIASAVDVAWSDAAALRLRVRSRIPSAGGIGSSAALSVATVAACERLRGRWEPARIARLAYEAEHAAQGGGSPNDTSVSTAGGTVFIAPEPAAEPGLEPLWSVERGDRVWFVHRAPPPRLDAVAWVVGHTGVKGVTSEQVEKARRFVERSAFGRETITAIGRLTREALDALRAGDAPALGGIMDRAQAHLVTLGVSHPSLDRLIRSVRAAPGTLGAKLTGAGGGGAMIALTQNPDAAATAIRAAGGRAFVLEASLEGVRAEPRLEVGGDADDDAGAGGAL